MSPDETYDKMYESAVINIYNIDVQVWKGNYGKMVQNKMLQRHSG